MVGFESRILFQENPSVVQEILTTKGGGGVNESKNNLEGSFGKGSLLRG